MKRGIFIILLLIVILAALLSAYFIREKDESAAVTTEDTKMAVLQAGAEGLTEYELAVAAPEETDHSDNGSAEPDEAASVENEEDFAAYSEETDFSNPYATETETRIGGYLYAIYEANKGCDADGEWFVDDSERFTYYEIYDPLDDEHLDANWEISLAEMKGTDKLAQAVNEYHAELFDSEKKRLQEKQKEVMAMDIEDYGAHLNGTQYSADIRTLASFEWGNIFIVVDMTDTMYTNCKAMPANFNTVTGEMYEFDDLFSTDRYNEELVRIIKNKFDGADLNWSSELDNGFFYFAISYHGLLLNKIWRSETVFIEWSELEDILAPEIKSDVLKYADWNNETAEPLL